jgi:signal transduction histidine kinase
MLGYIKGIVLHSTKQKKVIWKTLFKDSALSKASLNADTTRITQVMLNLIENAVQYTTNERITILIDQDPLKQILRP